MKVGKYEISQQVVAAGEVWMLSGRSFTFHDLQTFLIHQGVDHDLSYRAADRIIQRVRKLGHIQFNGKSWTATP